MTRPAAYTNDARPNNAYPNDVRQRLTDALRALLGRQPDHRGHRPETRLPEDRYATGHARRTQRPIQPPMTEPPAPPIALTPLLACDPSTDPDILWHIAREAPELRRWLVANPNADAALLEYVAQAGGPGVNTALTVLLEG